jgi:hypothetical protein
MHVLEARFHPWSTAEKENFVAVARIWCSGTQAVIEPIPNQCGLMQPSQLQELTKKLQYLVGTALPDPFRQLIAIESRYWVFEEVDSDGAVRRVATR